MEAMKADQQNAPASSKQKIHNRCHHHRVGSCGASIPSPHDPENDVPVCNGFNGDVAISRSCTYSQDDLNIHPGAQNYHFNADTFCNEGCKICARRSLPLKSAKQLFKNMKVEPFSNELVTNNSNHQARVRHRSAESITCTSTRSTDYGDDMNNYFQANAHLLQFLSNDSRHEGGGAERADEANGNGVNTSSSQTDDGLGTNCYNENHDQRRSRIWSDYDAVNDEIHTPSSEDDGIATSYNYTSQDLDEGCPDVFHNGIENINDVDASCMTNTMESDDQGDFIETDFVGHSNFDCMNSGDEKNFSSDEDINRYQHSDSNLIGKNCTGACNFDNNHQKETGKKVLQSPVFDRDDSLSEDRTVTSKNNSWKDMHVNDLSDTSVEDNAMDDCVPIINSCDRDINSRLSGVCGSVSHTSDSSIDCAITPESLSLWSPEVEYPELNTIELNHSARGLRAQCADNRGYLDPHSDDDGIGGVGSMEESFNIPNIPNNLNEVFSSDPSSDHEDELYNVSRQTSTSNFDNDENSFQGDDHENSNTDNEDKIFDEGAAAVRHFEEIAFSPDFHQKLRVDEATRGHYSRLLDYALSTSDEDEVPEREAAEPIYVDIGAEDQEASSSIVNGPLLNTETDFDERSASNTLPEHSRLVHKKLHKNSIQKIMVWSEYEAYISQVKQIGWSACGPTAVINVLKAFDVFCDKEKVNSVIKTNLRAEKASVPEYLLSRSVAGTTSPDLIAGINSLTDGAIYGRFFSFYPRRKVDILRWLGYWISRGAVPLVTLNLQKAVPPGWVTPDAWHHQMVYGVGPKGVYLTNPLEIVPVSIIEQQLCSESVLLVRRSDVLTRWTDDCDLSQLISVEDPRWREMNVLGQAVSVLREANTPGFQGYKLPWTSHICIPAVYKAGVSLYVKRDSESYKELLALEELPLTKEKKD
ncbi:uncharacterized protein LOC135495996 [Lineus longissimus]|uniref:uncharacterized protein LOC135495996 n=1 Tax=Lineus longissimus TaxID=88925 RepID=UPI002B4FAF89